MLSRLCQWILDRGWVRSWVVDQTRTQLQILEARVEDLEATVRRQGETIAAQAQKWENLPQLVCDIDLSEMIVRDQSELAARLDWSKLTSPGVEGGVSVAPAPEQHKSFVPERFPSDASSVIGGAEAVAPDAVDNGDGIELKAPLCPDSLALAERKSAERQEKAGQ